MGQNPSHSSIIHSKIKINKSKATSSNYINGDIVNYDNGNVNNVNGLGVTTDLYNNNFNNKSSIRRKSILLRSPFLRRKKSYKQHSISATFTAPMEYNIETLNINTATVEQLMTLPGITRKIAQNIVDHRNVIGGRFQKIDDLALVSGMGAEKLEKIRPEICAKRKTTINCNNSMQNSSVSSRTSSLDSLFSDNILNKDMQTDLNIINYYNNNNNNNNNNNQTKSIILNINKANIFQLQQINGMNQELAANVVDYRNKKGLYKKLDDLLKVKRMTPARLGAIRMYLCISDDDATITSTTNTSPINLPPQIPNDKRRNGFINNNFTTTNYNNNNNNNNLTTSLTPNHTNTYTHVRHHSAAAFNWQTPRKTIINNCNSTTTIVNNYNNNDQFKNVPINDIFELLCAYSPRPVVENNSKLQKNRIRIASWNLDKMCREKAENLGVKEVICRTILENNLSIICLQEINDEYSLKILCNELNKPKLKRIIDWPNNNRKWLYFYNRYNYGFIYDQDKCLFLNNESMLIDIEQDNKDNKYPIGYLGAFKLNDWTCYVLNCYIRELAINNKTNNIINLIEKSLEINRGNTKTVINNNKININDIYLLCGDFKYYYNNDNDNNIDITSLGYYNLINNYIDNNIFLRDKIPIKFNQNDYINKQKLNRSKSITTGVTIVPSTSANGIIAAAGTSSNLSTSAINEIASNKNKNNNNNSNSGEAINVSVPLTNNIYNFYNNTNNINSCNNSIKLTGNYGLISDGLCHMSIPNGWSWGGACSNYLPIWLELYTTINANTNLLLYNQNKLTNQHNQEQEKEHHQKQNNNSNNNIKLQRSLSTNLHNNFTIYNNSNNVNNCL